jgi:hypothetical protein
VCGTKKRYPTYGEALMALSTKLSRPELGSVYPHTPPDGWLAKLCELLLGEIAAQELQTTKG